ncbi:MAG: prenyltransferase [Anaerolineales bacterium]|nr:prenyltransferase [Anaerolineales bacterium]
MTNLRTLFRFSQPLRLILASLTYILGTGIARYLGVHLEGSAFWLGFVWILLIQVAAYLLAEYFHSPNEPLGEADTPSKRLRLRTLLLQVSAAALTLVAASTVVMLRLRIITPSSGSFLGLIFLLLMTYSVPPIRLVYTGFGELALAILIADFIPGLAFLLQADEFHRLLPLVAFPLTLLAVANFLALDFLSFASDQKYGRRTLLIRLTWPRAVPLHHALLLAAYVLFVAAPFFGFPWRLLWPVFLTLPLAAYQIFMLRNIALGVKPLWTILSINASAIFGLTAYLLTLSFWIR